MAVAVYDSDLTSANSGVVAVGNTGTDGGTWAESSNGAWDDQGVPGDETNFYINLTNCISAQATKTGQGTILYDHTADVTVDTNGAILLWCFWASPASLSTYANGGLKFIYGEDIGNFWAWDCSGSDFEPNPLGGWYCYALDPAIGSPDDTVGTVAGTGSCIGMAVNCTAQARGYPFAVNAIRAGRCTLEVTLGDGTAYGTFSGMESFDTSTNLRYGLFQSIYGSYRWQGLMSLGTAGTAVDFRDGNVSINVGNTPNVTSAFNRIEINHVDSNVEWNNVVITSPGVGNAIAPTASRGDFEVVDNATVALDGCSFTDMGTFIFNDGTNSNTITGTTFRRCDKITTGGATITGCVIDDTFNSTVALTTSSPANAGKISSTEFISGGTGHGLEITGTAADLTLTDVDFSGYSTTVDANKAIYVNIASGTVNLTISGGSGVTLSSHVRTAGATVNIISGAVTVKVTAALKNGTPVENALAYLRASDGTGPFPFEESVTITRTTTTATVTHTAHGMASNDKIILSGITDKTEDNFKVKQITVTDANTYTYTTTDSGSTSYTGTIVSTFVAITGLTGADGSISLSRVYSSPQPVVGWTRKSTTSPLLQEGVLVGTISNTTGFDGTAVMLSDE
jgi:hypothetical protein